MKNLLIDSIYITFTKYISIMDNSSRFVSFAENQLEELLKAKCSKRTDSVTKNAVQLLETFLQRNESKY